MDDKEMNVIGDIYSKDEENKVNKRKLNTIGPEDQRVEHNGSFFIGLATGVVTTLVVIILAVIVGTLLSKNYINVNDRDQLYQNAGLNGSDDNQKDMADIMLKMQYIQHIIDGYYYYDVDMNEMADSVYEGMLESLGDPYSVYYDKEAFAALMESTAGTYCGIGVVVQQNIETMEIMVVNPYEGCPGYEAGIQPGDIMLGTDEVDFAGMDLNEAVSYIKGEEGTEVVIHILRDGKEMEFKVARRMIDIPTVAYEKLEGNIAYIAISSFDAVTYEQFSDAIKQAQSEGCVGYVFDVRNNGGGLYDIVVDMLDDLLPKGKLVYTEDKAGKQEIEYSDEDCLNAPMAVLINGNSASASEVFAGAIQDYKAGKIIGTTSFGKGIVQSILPIGDGTAVKVTISSYFTPNGRNIHGQGIKPDIEIELPQDEEAYENGYLKREYDTQLNKAMEYIKEQLN